MLNIFSKWFTECILGLSKNRSLGIYLYSAIILSAKCFSPRYHYLNITSLHTKCLSEDRFCRNCLCKSFVDKLFFFVVHFRNKYKIKSLSHNFIWPSGKNIPISISGFQLSYQLIIIYFCILRESNECLRNVRQLCS